MKKTGERLLEKLERWELAPHERGGDPARRLDSVLAHLRRLLNTRQGNVPIAADFGAPDFLTMLQSFPDSICAMEKAIRSTIEKYEPRLCDVQVLFQPDQEETLTLRFEITAALNGDFEQRLSFESAIDIHGRVRIRSGSGERG